MTKKLTIYFVRHGQTYLNHYHRIQGIINAPLTPSGIQDAINAGKRLRSIAFDAAYSSDAPRAIETARLILKQNSIDIDEPIIDTAFREENFGYFEGSDSGQAWHIVGGAQGFEDYNDMIAKLTMGGAVDMIAKADPYGDAESDEDIKKRFTPGLKRVIDNANDGDNVLVAAHGSIIRWITSKYSPEIDVSSGPLNGSVTKMAIDGDDIKIVSYNQVQ